MNIILIINGKPGSGKDTFISEIENNVSKIKGYRCIHISTIDYIKQIAAECFEWNRVKDEKGRKFLSELKRISSEYNLMPFRRTTHIINSYIQQYKDLNFVFLIQSREPEDIKRFVDYYTSNCKTILIQRDIKINFDNYTDLNIENYNNYDFIIENNESIEEFKEKILNFIQGIINEEEKNEEEENKG